MELSDQMWLMRNMCVTVIFMLISQEMGIDVMRWR